MGGGVPIVGLFSRRGFGSGVIVGKGQPLLVSTVAAVDILLIGGCWFLRVFLM